MTSVKVSAESGVAGVADTLGDRQRVREHQQQHPRDAGIRAENLTVVYRNGTVALQDASFYVPRGSICGLVGINGAGKSTLFKAIMGFVPLASGEVSLLGKSAGRSLPRNTVAYVPQSEEVDWNFPVLVEDVVMMGRYGHMGFLRRPSHDDRLKVSEALKRVNIEHLRKRQIGELSGGQKKRVFLARALAQEGTIILLDEPFTGVDVATEDAIIDLLRELRDEGHVMLVSTHNLGSVPQFCDQVVLINKTVLGFGETEHVFNQDNLQRAFGGTLRFHVLSGTDLHDDDDNRKVTVISDDERPVVLYGDESKAESDSRPNGEGTIE
ncbi:MAG: manganese/iron ABC transporter ATP-binding protein [Gammaproteobacteria bacterium]|nr:manganese/iron ABC transporter ATP-binding protein [Gammaproteobacteria bacterium]